MTRPLTLNLWEESIRRWDDEISRNECPNDLARADQDAQDREDDRRYGHGPATNRSPQVVPGRAQDTTPHGVKPSEHPSAPTSPAPARTSWTRCQCGAWEKGYRHPGHRITCPRHARHDEYPAAA